MGQGAEVRWPPSEGPKVFAYLKAGYVGLEAILSALHGLPGSVLVHTPGVARKTVQQFTSARMTFSIQPLDMDQVRSSCDLALCHGGGGTTAALLLAGKPLVLFPMHMEQAMTARRLSELGVAITVVPEACGQLPRLLKKALSDSTLSQAAQKFSTGHDNYQQQNTIRLAADRCEALFLTRATP